MSDTPLLFDRRLLRQRRARFVDEIANREVLIAHVAREIAERVDIMLRPSARARPRRLSRPAWTKHRRAEIRGRVFYAESVYEYAARCPRPTIVCDEDLLPFANGVFNLVVSGLALHRVNDLPGSLIQIRRALAPDGLFMAAALGSNALSELRECLLEAEEEIERGASPRVSPFGDVRAYGALLQRAGFALPVTDAEDVTVIYPSPRELMREIRVLGGGNVLTARSKRPLSRRTLARAEELYRTRYGTPDGKVTATFQFVFMSGWAPDPSQQKPLAPGSARARLADALNTEERSAGDKASFPERKSKT